MIILIIIILLLRSQHTKIMFRVFIIRLQKFLNQQLNFKAASGQFQIMLPYSSARVRYIYHQNQIKHINAIDFFQESSTKAQHKCLQHVCRTEPVSTCVNTVNIRAPLLLFH